MRFELGRIEAPGRDSQCQRRAPALVCPRLRRVTDRRASPRLRLPQGADQTLQVGWRFALEMQVFAAHRVLEPEHGRVQSLAAEAAKRLARLRRKPDRLGLEPGPIALVAEERVADLRHMDPDLVRAAG